MSTTATTPLLSLIGKRTIAVGVAATVVLSVVAALAMRALDAEDPAIGGADRGASAAGAFSDPIVALNTMADIAARGDRVTVADKQLIVTDIRGLAAVCDPTMCTLQPQPRQLWYDPHLGQLMKILEGDKDLLSARGSPATKPAAPGMKYPTVGWLASLPQDPRTLLEYFEAEVSEPGMERSLLEWEIWDHAGELYSLCEIALSPEVRAAVLRALAMTSGLSLRNVEVDGKSLVAIQRDGARTATEIIFDPLTGRAVGRATAYKGTDRKIVQAQGGPALAAGMIYQVTWTQSIVNSF